MTGLSYGRTAPGRQDMNFLVYHHPHCSLLYGKCFFHYLLVPIQAFDFSALVVQGISNQEGGWIQ